MEVSCACDPYALPGHETCACVWVGFAQTKILPFVTAVAGALRAHLNGGLYFFQSVFFVFFF